MIKIQISVVDEGKVLGTAEVDLTPQAPPQEPQVPEDKMSDAQRRYLFRLLADMGIEGEGAREAIKEQAGVHDVKEVTKARASWLIEKLKTQVERAKTQTRKEGTNGSSQ